MKTKLAIAAVAASLLSAPFAAHAQNSGDCMAMIPQAIENQLRSEGFGMSNLCDLSLGDVAVIKSLLDEQGMNARSQIQNILDKAS